jgi:uncharacterized protein
MDRFNCPVEFKFAIEGKPDGYFTGYGAVFGNVDSHDDVIQKGAFRDTLREAKKSGKMPKMLLQHGMGLGTIDSLPIGKWLSMEEDDTGLKVEGQLFALNTERGQYIHEGLKSGELDGLSIGYKAIDFSYGSRVGEPRRTLKKVNLNEVSVLTFGSNDKARINSVKSAADYTPQDWRALEAALRDEGLSRSDAVKAVSGFKSYLQRDAGVSDTAPRDEAAAEEQQLRDLASRIRALSA